MAIRTITDLPDISTAAELSSNLSKSRMEISWLENEDTSTYQSRSVSCGVLSEAIAADILSRQLLTSDSLDLNGHLTVKDGLSVEGDLYANVGKSPTYHNAKLNFANIDISSNVFNITSNDAISLKCGNAEVSLQNDSSRKGIVNLKQYARVENTEEQNDGVVNVRFLKEKLDKLSADLIDAINRGIATIDINVDIDFPLLGIIYIDHPLDSRDNNTAWAIAGSTVDLTKHKKLREFVACNKLRYKGSGDKHDTWVYTYNEEENTLTLPTTDWFFQSIKTPKTDAQCEFNAAGLPQHTHSYTRSYETAKYGQVHVKGSSGIYVGVGSVGSTTGNASGSIYAKNLNTVQPNATKMFVYFYVGQESK